MASAGTISRNRPTSIERPSVVLYQSVAPVRPPKALPLLLRGRRERVGHLGEAVGPGVEDRRLRRAEHHGGAGEAEHRDRHGQDVEHDELHLGGLDLLAEVLRACGPTISPAMNTASRAKINMP